ncbi:MAG: CCA tRNA nucleotidyltransferase [Silicimonas sp.]|nr:CCA tRNA nucleotidyltransferase [Silicimonas sp.]
MARIDADWLNAPATQGVFHLLTGAGHPAYAVGGAVRNTLLGAPVKDIDLCTDARPDTVMQLARKAGLQAVPTGISFGTVTVLWDDTPFEITTFRRDVETDGRRAVVAFSTRIEEDALRRDFTMNALYCDADGAVVDPLGGLPDLRARRIRFIENAGQRIREDYLRSLRYFRFHAWYGDPGEGFDAEALDAIAGNLDGLAGLSRERVGAEIKRLLEAPDPAPAVAGMRSTGMLHSLLPGADDKALAPLVALEDQTDTEAAVIRRLAALGGADLAEGLRLSKKEATRLETLRQAIGMPPGELGYRLGAEIARDVLLLTAALLETPLNRDALTCADEAATRRFPIRAVDLMPRFQGIELGARLKSLEAQWIASGFTLTRADLLGMTEGEN